MGRLIIEGGARLSGRVAAPPDKSILHRALILAALGPRRAHLFPLIRPAARWSAGADNRATVRVLRALGVRIEEDDTGWWVDGVGGPSGFQAPAGPLDCDNSGTTMRMMAGVLAAFPGEVTLIGDASLSRRPMGRLWPLVQMGAALTGSGEGDRRFPPLTIRGGPLRGGRFELPIASAQVKSALLLAGLYAAGPTTVKEPARSRDHTERLLLGLGVGLVEDGEGALTLTPPAALPGQEPWPIVPDLSGAAFLLAAAAMTGSDQVEVETGLNPTRAGFLEALTALGVPFTRIERGLASGEPFGGVQVRGGPGAAAELGGGLVLRAIDEVPILAALATQAPGTTRIRDAAELRVKESDRLAATRGILTAFGARVEEEPGGLVVEGPARLRGCTVDARGDHRIAMTAAVLGLVASGQTVVEGAEVIDVSYPGFASTLEALGARIRGASADEELV